MVIRRINKMDFVVFSNWYKKGNKPRILREKLPPTGYIVPGYCAGWLSVSKIKYIVVNPDIAEEEIDDAVDMLVRALLSEAKRYKVKKVTSMLKHKNVVKRIKKFKGA